MGLFSDNYYSYLYSKITMDEINPEFERKHPREGKGGAKGGQFTKSNSSVIKEDDVGAAEEKEWLALPGGKKIHTMQAFLYRWPDGKLHDEKFSPFLKKMGGTGAVSEELSEILDRLFGGEDVPDAEIESTPEWSEAMARAKRVESKLQADNGSPYTSAIESTERNALRDAIVSAALSPTISKEVPISGLEKKLETNEGLKEGESYEVERGKKAFIAIGFPAAGKSTTFANPLAKKYKARLCDSDSIKKVLPEFDNGYGGNAVHQESSLLNEAILAEAIENGDNIVYPILGFKPEKLRGVIQLFKAKGYEVGLCFKDMPVNMAKGRLLVRFLTKGRYLPLQCISKAKGGLHKSFESAKELADSYLRTTNPNPYSLDDMILDKKGQIL